MRCHSSIWKLSVTPLAVAAGDDRGLASPVSCQRAPSLRIEHDDPTMAVSYEPLLPL